MRPQFLGRRQQHLTASVATRIDASAGVGGLAARLSEDHYFAIEADGTRGATIVAARARLSGIEHTWSDELPAGEILFRIEMEPPPNDFSQGAIGGDRIRLTAAGGGEEILLAELDGRYWTFETAKCFTGRVIGLYATSGEVSFAEFRYRGSA